MALSKVDHVEEISEERVRHVALLSRLELTDDEVSRFSSELTGVIHHINKLEELNLTDIEPTSHPMPLTDVVRQDVVEPSLSNGASVANAPEEQDGCFKVPQII